MDASPGLPLVSFLGGWATLLAVLLIPGGLLVRTLGGRSLGRLDLVSGLALRLAIGLAFWPVLFLLTSSLGWRWSSAGARTLLAALVLAWIGTALASGRRTCPRAGRRDGWALPLALAAIFALIAGTRWWHVRALVLPPWVDSVHHTLVVRLLLARGALPETCAPFVPGAPFDYHWGWHASVAFAAWIGGTSSALDVARLVLESGQLVNALVPVAVFLAGTALFRSRLAGAFAALLAGLVSWYPAYYAAWGRYTQLAGLVLLPAAVVLLSRAVKVRSRGLLLLSALAVSGLFLVHVRVFLFFLVSAPFFFLAGPARGLGRRLGTSLAVGLVAAVFAAPWVVRLASSESAASLARAQTPAEREKWREYNEVPSGLLWSPHNRELFALATGGLTGIAGLGDMPLPGRLASACGTLLIVGLSVRRRRRLRPAAPWAAIGLVALSSATLAAVLNVDALGLPPLRIAPNSAAVIGLFLPASLAGAGWLAWLLRRILPLRRLRAVASVVLVAAAAWAAWSMRDVVGDSTVLASARDLKALEWVRGHVPSDARFAIRSQLWIQGTWIGLDGGYWLPVLADRASTLPPALYPFLRDRREIEKIDAFQLLFSQTSSLDGPVGAALAERGVTHLFVGETPGVLSAEGVRLSPRARALYEDGPVAVFEFR
jgi:hypothetical protein